MLLLIAAAAGAPPPNLNLDDVDAWEDAAFALTHGPVGKCWDITGFLSAELALYQPASVFSSSGSESVTGSGTFSGRLENGVWTSFSYAVTSSDGDLTVDLPIMPLVGAIDPSIVTNLNAEETDRGDASADTPPEEEDARSLSLSISEGDPEESMNLLRDSIDAWFSGSITTSFMRWSDPRSGAELVIEVPTSDKRNAPLLTATAFFPGGGKTATELDSVLPKRLTLGDWPLRMKVMDGQLHLRGQVVEGILLPSRESWSVLLGVFGLTVGYEQRLVYRSVSECR
ncbi:MAG: hypothetical protein P8R54_22855 [Myxococcota bacterium]|nr:hypothetical protein [Myxococcota bacterium]